MLGDVWSVLGIVSEVLVAIAVILSVWILVPQIIRLHKNKYADNSAAWTYMFYIIANTVWLVYQTLYIVLNYRATDDLFLEIMLWTQWVGDVLSVAIGVYSWALKMYYSHTRKYKKDSFAEKLILTRAEYAKFYNDEKVFVVNKLHSLYKKYPELVLKVTNCVNHDDLVQKLEKATTTEVCVYVTNIQNHLFLKNKDRQYLVDTRQYNTELNQIKKYITGVCQKYPTVVYESNHCQAKQKALVYEGLFRPTGNKKKDQEAMKKINYEIYMRDISLVAAWSYLCEIYQNFLSI